MSPPEEKTCQWYVSIDQPECGEPAPHRVKVKTKVTKATVYLCNGHKQEHDVLFAKIRTAKSATK